MLTTSHLPEISCVLCDGQLAKLPTEPGPSGVGVASNAPELDALIIFNFSDKNLLEQTEFACLASNPAWGDFKGKAAEVAVLYLTGVESSQCPARRVLLVGLGEAAKFSMDTLRLAAATALQRCSQLKLARVGFWAGFCLGQFEALASAAKNAGAGLAAHAAARCPAGSRDALAGRAGHLSPLHPCARWRATRKRSRQAALPGALPAVPNSSRRIHAASCVLACSG